MKYLDKALTQLRDLGLLPDEQQEAPIVALLNRISDLDEDRVVAIARTLSQASLFNEIVREQITGMEIGERYEKIAKAFDSIRKDARNMVEQFEDGDISAWERLHNIWVKVTRGDIAHRFDKIKETYLEVADDTREQIERERVILTAYMDFRGALKEAEVLAFEVLEQGEAEVERAKAALETAVKAVEADVSREKIGRAIDEAVAQRFIEDNY